MSTRNLFDVVKTNARESGMIVLQSSVFWSFVGFVAGFAWMKVLSVKFDVPSFFIFVVSLLFGLITLTLGAFQGIGNAVLHIGFKKGLIPKTVDVIIQKMVPLLKVVGVDENTDIPLDKWNQAVKNAVSSFKQELNNKSLAVRVLFGFISSKLENALTTTIYKKIDQDKLVNIHNLKQTIHTTTEKIVYKLIKSQTETPLYIAGIVYASCFILSLLYVYT
eukprot:TRINITY_DN6069_c0_g1_i1.p1 TRINITY_DN6069_c0_g1~~TRINITY_DN6069_c0_g1_i1.p1  ORF type:complete len:220 (+),score=37.33 TRINITY_DN6069_c0_g1_i1:160-819(+)